MFRFIFESIGVAMTAMCEAMAGMMRVSPSRERIEEYVRRREEELEHRFGKPKPKEDCYAGLSGAEIDAMAIASDWEKVGNDLRAAMDQYKSGKLGK